jgi:hypothetical protein
MQGDIKSHNLPAIVGQNEHYIQQPKRCSSHDKHVDGSDTLGLIEQEATPGRGRRTASAHLYLATVAWLISMPSLRSSP